MKTTFLSTNKNQECFLKNSFKIIINQLCGLHLYRLNSLFGNVRQKYTCVYDMYNEKPELIGPTAFVLRSAEKYL